MERPAEIEMLFAPGCGSMESTRAMVAGVIAESGLVASIREAVVTDPLQAEQARFLGSPSVRVNGIDVEPEAASRTDYGLG